MAKFPAAEWPLVFKDKLNSDDQYARIAQNWEGDFYFVIDPDDSLLEQVILYFDLWHGTCRQAYVVEDNGNEDPTFELRAPYQNYIRILKGELHPMQALMTRKLKVKGNLALLMRNVPTVLDFVRCAREVTDSFV
jgi:putative sterol carrier protein